MKADLCEDEPMRNSFETFQRAGVNGIHSRTHQDDVLQLWLSGDTIINGIFQRTGVREVQAFVNPD
jgi:hypothetical protein